MPLEDVGTEEIDPVRYAEFKKWEEKKSEKKSENAMSTQGELLTKGEFLDRLEERKVSKEAKALSSAHNKVKKVARQRQKVVDEVEKEKADREKTEVEEIVKAVLAQNGLLHVEKWLHRWARHEELPQSEQEKARRARRLFGVAEEERRARVPHRGFHGLGRVGLGGGLGAWPSRNCVERMYENEPVYSFFRGDFPARYQITNFLPCRYN